MNVGLHVRKIITLPYLQKTKKVKEKQEGEEKCKEVMNEIKAIVSKESAEFVIKMLKNKVIRENVMLLKKN